MLDAAIDEVNPSLNREFVEPCRSAFGLRRVNEYLLDVVESGTDFSRAGAVNALYWRRCGSRSLAMPHHSASSTLPLTACGESYRLPNFFASRRAIRWIIANLTNASLLDVVPS